MKKLFEFGLGHHKSEYYLADSWKEAVLAALGFAGVETRAGPNGWQFLETWGEEEGWVSIGDYGRVRELHYEVIRE